MSAALIRGLSDRSRYRRFLSAGSWDAASYLADLGSEGHVGLVADTGGELVGMAELIPMAAGERAEVAFAVADTYRDLGLGTALARARGTGDLVASTAPTR